MTIIKDIKNKLEGRDILVEKLKLLKWVIPSGKDFTFDSLKKFLEINNLEYEEELGIDLKGKKIKTLKIKSKIYSLKYKKELDGPYISMNRDEGVNPKFKFRISQYYDVDRVFHVSNFKQMAAYLSGVPF